MFIFWYTVIKFCITIFRRFFHSENKLSHNIKWLISNIITLHVCLSLKSFRPRFPFAAFLYGVSQLPSAQFLWQWHENGSLCWLLIVATVLQAGISGAPMELWQLELGNCDPSWRWRWQLYRPQLTRRDAGIWSLSWYTCRRHPALSRCNGGVVTPLALWLCSRLIANITVIIVLLLLRLCCVNTPCQQLFAFSIWGLLHAVSVESYLLPCYFTYIKPIN